MRFQIMYSGASHGSFLKMFIDKFSKLSPPLEGSAFSKDDSKTVHGLLNWSGLVTKDHPLDEYPYYHNIDDAEFIHNEPGPTANDPVDFYILVTISTDDLLFLERITHIRAGATNLNIDGKYTKFTKNYLEYFDTKSLENLYGVEHSDEDPIVPQFIVRDWIKLGFLNPNKMGYITRTKTLIQHMPKNCVTFPVGAFWNTDKFIENIKILNNKINAQIEINNESINVHKAFVNRLQKIDTINRCNTVIDCLKNKTSYDITQLDTVEQAFISAYVELTYDFIKMPLYGWFENTQDILDYIKWYPQHYKAMNGNLPKFNNINNPFYLHKHGKKA